MEKLISEITKMNDKQLDAVLHAFMQRHKQLHPDWEIHILSLDKALDRSLQIDRVIALLTTLKEQE